MMFRKSLTHEVTKAKPGNNSSVIWPVKIISADGIGKKRTFAKSAIFGQCRAIHLFI